MKDLIAVVGMEDGPEGSPGPSVIGALRAAGTRSLAVALSPQEAGIWREPRAHAVLVLPVNSGPAELAAVLRKAKVTLALPGSFAGALLLAEAGPWLAAAKICTTNAHPDALLRHVRTGLHAFNSMRPGAHLARGLDVLTPAHAESLSLAQAWPQVLLSDCGLTQRVRTAQAARKAVERLRSAGAERLTLLETMPGCLVEVALVRIKGEVAGAMAVQVIADDDRERPWCAVSIDDPALVAWAGAAAKELAFDGPVTLRFQQHGVTPLLMEVRPTFPHWIEAAAVAGAPLVERLLAGVLNRPWKGRVHARAGVLFSASAEDAVISPVDLLAVMPPENAR